MWKVLVFNSVWFVWLFWVPFFAPHRWRVLSLLSLFAAAVFTLTRGQMDPFGFFFYSLYSLVVFVSVDSAWVSVLGQETVNGSLARHRADYRSSCGSATAPMQRPKSGRERPGNVIFRLRTPHAGRRSGAMV